MKKLMLSLGSSAAALLATAAPALADTMPVPGPDFGQHVSTMAQSGMMTGSALAQCVSTMAAGLACICGCPCGM
ncbi:MAG TPA: hypothetical protein VFR33_13740 [Candidatus Dormibacteraeota bacterium]|nr:hypothetical protein [Candidatus Dormibacteraeota bacterium]